ncbi:NADH-quinone oxidoreductase subunit NuoG [Advenella mimigardefordensis]|uniref:NADH-quinone oxidoreductase n=1 Tax=Advenella mimigardefordensis (strain DSM 17166 / LMG 22922 / DPN7) TaxID=1247726 RepID=W0PG63_ADVMD|nr:NADH-quinone oxidoreductase subunit NuoG [Advenella mimigardefordensis]AHG64527.1 NADH-quinone oxidoreductase subunit G [Advenella mimigardefordensis DPN7]
MVELTIDGKPVSVPEGSMVMHAASELGLYVPHFCYHKKLSIAANCRMCLVEVEKAPKALPACATPVTQGMVVHTCSAKAVAAQKSVMEFLLINHPLDCPICDQGGECQLQDLAVGYGNDESRYREEKRVVFHKDVGPLVSAEEMSRCIHCTRCVRFGQEVAGVMELGMLNRGEHSEIQTFVGNAIESELSGNMIDLCPVGALTSKPFRYTARTWELARRRSISAHDSVGSNLVVQVKGDQVKRVVPFENEEINECWISDKDRWSYEGLNVADRLQTPMIKGDDGVWREASWNDALTAAAQVLERINQTHGDGQIGALATEYSTVEELALLARLTRGLGSQHIDFRLRQTDAGFEQSLQGLPWLGMPIAELNTLDRVLVIGSVLRKDHPLFAQRLRQAAKHGTQIVIIDTTGDDPLIPTAKRITVAPDQLPAFVAQVAAAGKSAEQAVPAPGKQDLTAADVAAILAGGSKSAVFLGNMAVASPHASQLAVQAQTIAQQVNGTLGFLTAGANTVGGYLAGAVATEDGMNVAKMMNNPLKAYLVLHAEPALDMDDGDKAEKMLAGAFSIALTSYKSAAESWARIMLPVAPFTETSGTFVNAEGRAQSFKGVVAGLGQSRPAWKVLRVLGNILKLTDFEDETSESVRDSVLLNGFAAKLSNKVTAVAGAATAAPVADGALQRVADLPIYRTDAIVRRAESLQQAPASAAPVARLNAATLARLGVQSGDTVKVRGSNGNDIQIQAKQDDRLADNTVRIAQGFAQTAALGSAFGNVFVEKL